MEITNRVQLTVYYQRMSAVMVHQTEVCGQEKLSYYALHTHTQALPRSVVLNGGGSELVGVL